MVLVTLVGEQPIPNLIPLWQDDQRQYNTVQFVASETTKNQAKMLAEIIKSDPDLNHLNVLEPVLVDAYDIGKARMSLIKTVSLLEQQGQEIIFNLTGGTKIMSFAALRTSIEQKIPMLYVSTELGQIIYMGNDGSETRRDNIKINIGVHQYLSAHGLEVGSNLAFRPIIGEKPYSPPKEGDWLEELVERKSRESGYFDDVQRNVFIRKQTLSGFSVNELDVVVTLNGQLSVCSCKTSANLEKDEIYELAALSRRESAGIYCGKVLVSSMNEMPPSMIERARSMGVNLVCGNEVNHIALHIRNTLQRQPDKKLKK